MNCIKDPIILQGNYIEVIPLQNSHFKDLIELSKDKIIWEHYAIDGSDTTKLILSLESALLQKEKGTQYPFVIKLLNENKIVGSTRFLDIQPEHRKLEIGWTWLHPDYWGSRINLECKFLLLAHCFEHLFLSRVQLKTDENNKRSRKAIEKLGAQYEGVFRNDMLRDNGTKRNSVYYSIIDNEWLKIKNKLLELFLIH
ncbi:MAG: N-acetyltransferase [Pedobacter sp.]|nr:MAG: N-acetyltransferase [Pedobacter sp.]